MDLSIIIPVYNVEEYIHACIESIYEQGLEDASFEVIIVDDGSEDKSLERIAGFSGQHPNMTIIHQSNQGLSAARNNGLAAAKGEYVMLMDSDDLLFRDSLPLLLDKALESKADLVSADFIQMNDEEIAQLKSGYPPQEEFEMQEMEGEDFFLNCLDPHSCYVWHTLYRRAFLTANGISFIPGIFYEDIPFTHECYLRAGKGLSVRRTLYIYRERSSGSITSHFTYEKAASYCKAIASTWRLRGLDGLSPRKLHKLEEDVYCSFSMLIYHTIAGISKASERRQLMLLLNAEAPGLRFTHGIRQRLTTFMIRRAPALFIELYYIYTQIKHKKSAIWTK